MNKIISIALITGALFGFAGATQFSVGISGSERGINGFALSVGDYYRVPHNEILVIERSVPYEEMSVVYFLARQAHRDARYIADLRLHGLSWWDISLRLGLDPYVIFAVDTVRYYGPPYGVAYGYNVPGRYRLRDSEIINLVNVRFLSTYHHISADDVINRRRSGERFMHIDDYYRQNRQNRQYTHPRVEERRIERNQREEQIYREKRNQIEKRNQVEERNTYRDDRNYREERQNERNKERNERRDQERGHGNSDRGNREH